MNAVDLIKEVRRLARKSPNNTYSTLGQGMLCSYLSGDCSDGSCGCIFGQALRNLGFSISELKTCETIDTKMKMLGIKASAFHKIWCMNVQNFQDKGTTWEQAVSRSDKMYPEIVVETQLEN